MRHCPNSDCPHLQATGRAGEYRDDIDACSDCGSALAPGEPPAAASERDAIQWETVLTVPQAPLAHMAKTALAAAGVPCEVRRHPGQGDGIVPATGGELDIVVPAHLAEAAAEVLSGQPLETVPLPDDDDLEFVDVVGESEVDLATEAITGPGPHADPGTGIGTGTGTDDTPAPENTPAGQRQPCCPRCGSFSVMRVSPGSPSESRGFFKQLFAGRPDWCCVSCEHHW